MAIPGQGEAVVQVGFGPVVLDVSGVDLRVQERQAAGDLVLLFLHQVQRHGAFEVCVQELGPPVVEVVALGEVGAAFTSGDVVEAVELGGDEFSQRSQDVRRNLDLAVEVLDRGLDVGHEHRLALTGGALGMAARTDEVG